MTRTPPPTPVLHFGPFKLDIPGAQLTRDGAAIALRPKALDLLAGLAQRPQELVTKGELLDSVWGRRFITEGVIKNVSVNR
jgi:two-component system response regulator MtrA